VFTERTEGVSKMTRDIFWESLALVWKLWIGCGFRRSPKARTTESPVK